MQPSKYIQQLFVKDGELRSSISETLQRCGISANSVSSEVAKTLFMLVKISGAKKILEIGTLGGYSTIWLAKALEGDGEITSLEISSSLSKLAALNAKDEHVDHLISFRVGHALESLSELKAQGKKFNLVFIDADKENYSNYLNEVLDIVDSNALIVADNVLWRNRIFDESDQNTSTIGIRKFNEQIATDERLDSMLVTVGDGLIVARVK